MRLPLLLPAAAAALLALAGEPRAADVRRIPQAPGIPKGNVTALLAADGRLYAAVAEKGLYVYDTGAGTVRRFGGNDGLPSDDVRSLALYGGRVYAGTAGGIGAQDGERWLPTLQAKGFPLRNVLVASSPDGKRLWACAKHLSGGIFRFDGKEWWFMGGQGRGLFNDVSAIAFPSGAVLLGAAAGMVYEFKGEQVEALSDGFPAANVNALEERGGAYYLGTNRGLFVWRGKGWTRPLVPQAFVDSPVFALLRVESDLFVAGVRGLLLLDRKGGARILSGRDGFPEGPVTALGAGGKTVFAATDQGVIALQGWDE